MKLFLVLLALFVSSVLTGRVQRQTEDKDNCSLGDNAGKRCVNIEYCAPKFPDKNPCSDFEDLDYTCTPEDNCNPIAFTPRLSIDERYDQAENATCTDQGHVCCHEDNLKEYDYEAPSKTNNDPPTILKDALCVQFSSVHENQICCPEDRIQQPTTETFGCNEKKAEGYGCNKIDECDEATIDTFGFCRSTQKNICCIKKQQEPTCKGHQDKNYQCVPSKSCRQSPFQTLTVPPVLTCENSGDKCCEESQIRLPCESFDDELGFSCKRNNLCLDLMFPNVANTIEGRGKCSKGERCCKHKKPDEEVRGSCSGNGYSCNQVPLCKLDSPFLKSEPYDLLELLGRKITIDNEISLCDKDDEVCCVPSTVSPAPPPGPPGSEPPIIVRDEPRRCGVRNPNGLTTKAKNPQDGDTSTTFGEWTFPCLIYKKRRSRLDPVGGATLIAPGVLVTAAHKIIDNNLEPRHLLVRCGEWDVSRDEDEEVYPSQSRDVDSISLHPLYSSTDLANDIAILHVTEDFILADHLGVACLPNDNQEESNFEHNDCVFMGWGSRADPKTDFTATTNFQPILEAFHGNPIIKKEECEEKVRPINWPENAAYERPDSIICAGGIGADPCKGDAGGPLACPLREEGEETRYVLAGVVAGVLPGGQCGTSDLPAAYSSVANNICFIHWATQCKSKEKYRQYFWYPQCNNWIKETKKAVEDYDEYFHDDYFDDIGKLEDTCI